MASITSMIATLAFFLLAQYARGHAFLKKQDAAEKAAAQFLNKAKIEMQFLAEVRGSVGIGPGDAQLPGIQKALEPMWIGLPKNEHGRLGNAQVRYALHRYFVQRHGWHIDGLDRAVHESTLGAVLREEVPTFLMDLFEEAFGKSGLMLHELAIFAATLEHMIHQETIDRLKDVYNVLLVSQDQRMSEHQADLAVKIYAMSLMFGQDKLVDKALVAKHLTKLERHYPAWGDMQVWLKDVRGTVAYMDEGMTNPFVGDQGLSFGQVRRIAEQVSDKLGQYQDFECRQLKDSLLELEDQAVPGRVQLSDFYRKGVENDLQFAERPEYLRQLGALDESHPGEPRVIVANYMLSKGNCLADMGFYSVCCINECESLMAKLEKAIEAPEATPERVAAVVASLSTSSVEPMGGLSEMLGKRLGEIAARSGGKVPLHGRLFAQWLHFIFPRECPYPHAAGSLNPLSASEWFSTTSQKATMKLKEMNSYIESASQDTGATDLGLEVESSMHWSEEEELLYLPAETEMPRTWAGAIIRSALACAVLAGVAVALMDSAKRSGGLQVCLGGKENAQLV